MTEKQSLVKDIMENALPQGKHFSTEEVMEIFGIKRKMTIYEWNNKGYLHPYKIGKRNFYTRRDVAEYMASKILESRQNKKESGEN